MNIVDFPELTSSDFANAKLYANRNDLIRDLRIAASPVVAEVGVALGTFSKFLIEALRPAAFHGFDLFQLHLQETLWGMKTTDALRGLAHADFYKQEMAATRANVVVHEGPSDVTLPRLADRSFDLIYIDAEHTYNGVKRDADIAVEKLKSDGVLVFNDYVMYDPFLHVGYGIVPVVNHMVVNQGWKVVGFALQKHLFCDIAIKRP